MKKKTVLWSRFLISALVLDDGGDGRVGKVEVGGGVKGVRLERGGDGGG